MKKLLVVLFVCFTTITSMNALELADFRVFYNMNNETTHKSMQRYLKLTDCQKQMFNQVFEVSESKFYKAIDENNEIAAEEAIRMSMKKLNQVLNDDQYRKFVALLDLTIENSRNNYIAAE